MMRSLNLAILTSTLFIIALVSCGSCGHKDEIVNPEPGNSDTTVETPPGDTDTLFYLYKSASEGYSCFRIPAIIQSQKGTLLAFAEARKNTCGDAGDIDMVVKRSTDGGKTWNKMITVWDETDNTCGNPVPIVDQSTGTIWLLMTWNLWEDNLNEIVKGTSKDTRRVFVTHSDDDGLTWTTPVEITNDVKKPTWSWYATGPCHGIQIQNGKYAGRLVASCDYITLHTGEGSSHIIYSDDHGQTWKLGGVIQQGKVNESTVAELSDGSLMLSMRNGSGYRKVATSTDGGISWSDAKADPQLLDPNCQGSLLSSHDSLFFSNPSSSTARENMTVKLSTDNGQTWNKSFPVYSGPSAYSDIVKIDDSHLGELYEAGKLSPYEGIAFKIISIANFK